MANNDLQLIKPVDAAKLLCVTPRTLRRYEERKLLHAVKLNSRNSRYKLSEIQHLIEKAAA